MLARSLMFWKTNTEIHLNLDIGQLCNLSSGVHKESGVEEFLLIEESGSIAARVFRKNEF